VYADKEGSMRVLYVIAAVLLAFWVAGLAFRITAGIIHVALVAAVVLFIYGFLRGRTGRATI
jgi:hypothetical protein